MHAECFPRPLADRSGVRGGRRAYRAIEVDRRESFWTITLSRPEARNSIDACLLDDMHAALDELEDARAKVLVLRGQSSVFCTGLDLRAGAAGSVVSTSITERFMALMKRLSSMPKIVVALVDGEVMAGGIGLVAASDFAIASSRSTFGLSEALWGLLPAMVLPFMIRRTGFGNAYAMTLSAETIGAEAARAMHLVDEVLELGEGDWMRLVERKVRRFERIDGRTIGEIKAYFRELWIVDDATERGAVREIDRLLSDPRIQTRMKDYAETGRLPWEHEAER